MKAIETGRLLLRPFTTDDLDAIHTVLSYPDVWKYDPGKPRTLAETGQTLAFWITEYQRHGFGRFAVIQKATNQLIGYCGLQWLLLDHGVYKQPEVELFYALDPAFWGQGYITESAQAVIRFGFDELKLRRIVSTAIGGNHRSVKVMRRVGMRVERDPFDPDWIVGVIDNANVDAQAPALTLAGSR
jgi:ribosomal-protein-alanine N-acetyltransferase